ncbi:MAG: Hsp20/alpha crystallin family protein [Candidatus Abyssobacteria bacterium SURF_5]|uniref:Hsp20/alpha crystallin family protein n=1 Tax=Abyssobacteria bacterium (strain SURF_5) TaxID=2093360 RepID=A0A3A4NV08_ABYX5|nr:MAG: Hsp20/alpha crystallin family protein [Candidatus Abyssubacteria bacterium SURF_5]
MYNQSNVKTTILIVLVALLVTAVAAQSYYLFKMHGEMQKITGTQSNPESKHLPEPTLPQATADPWIDHDWLNAPFDPDAWNPFDEMQQMQDRMNSIFNSAFGRFGKSSRFGSLYHEPAFSPKMDMREEEDRYVIRMDVPGIDETKLVIQVQDQTVRVQGKREELVEESDKGGRMVRRERKLGQFDRSMSLPGPVNQEKLTTSYESGILTIILPKKDQS